MAVYLITGNPGSGKSSLVEELSRRGSRAVDTDEIAGWVDRSGRPARQPRQITSSWLAAHEWVWTRDAFERAIESGGTEDVFFCGIARNQLLMLELFDAVFLLSLDDLTQVERLDAPSNASRNAAQRDEIIKGRAVFEAEMREAGATVLDGRRPTASVAAEVLAIAAERRRSLRSTERQH
jgi:hypothetical protein